MPGISRSGSVTAAVCAGVDDLVAGKALGGWNGPFPRRNSPTFRSRRFPMVLRFCHDWRGRRSPGMKRWESTTACPSSASGTEGPGTSRCRSPRTETGLCLRICPGLSPAGTWFDSKLPRVRWSDSMRLLAASWVTGSGASTPIGNSLSPELSKAFPSRRGGRRYCAMTHRATFGFVMGRCGE